MLLGPMCPGPLEHKVSGLGQRVMGRAARERADMSMADEWQEVPAARGPKVEYVGEGWEARREARGFTRPPACPPSRLGLAARRLGRSPARPHGLLAWPTSPGRPHSLFPPLPCSSLPCSAPHHAPPLSQINPACTLPPLPPFTFRPSTQRAMPSCPPSIPLAHPVAATARVRSPAAVT